MKAKDTRISWYIEQLEELAKNPKIKILGLSKPEFLAIIDDLFGPIQGDKNRILFIDDPHYIHYARQKLAEIENLEFYLNASNVPLEITQAVEEFSNEGEIERTRLEARDKVEAFIKKQTAIQTNITKLAQAEQKLTQEIDTIVQKNAPELSKNKPQLVKELAKEIEEEFVLNFFEAPQQVLKKETYETIIDRVSLRIDQTLEEKSIPLNPQETTKLKAALKVKLPTKTLSEASTLTQIDFKLPRTVREKIPIQGTAFSPTAALFHPVDSIRKFTNLPVRAAQVAIASELSDEESIKEQLEAELRSPRRDNRKIARLANMLEEVKRFRLTNRELTYSVYGVTSQDLKKSVEFLRKELGAGHPVVRFLEIQEARQGRFELKFANTRERIRSFFSLNQHLGQRPAIIELRGQSISLPSPEPLSDLSRAFNQIGTATRFYQTITEYPGIRVVRSLPLQKMADFRSFVYRRTLHPLFGRLAKTTFGKAIKTGIQAAFKETTKKAIVQGLKKAGTWLVTKLGIKGITTAIGTALAPGIGTAIGAVVGFVIEPIIKFGKDLLSRLKRIITKPEFALGALGIGTLGLLAFSAPTSYFIAVPAFALSVPGLIASAGGIFGSAAAATIAALSVFFAPLAIPIAAFVISLVIGLMAITLFIVFMTAGAFIVPAAPTERISEYFEVTKTADHGKIENKDLPATINYIVTVEARQEIKITSAYDERNVTCQPGSNPQFERRIDLPLNSKGTSSWEAKYSLDVDDSFKDCRLCNTATVIANIEGGPSGEMDYDTQCIDIGEPPEDCPSDWPTEHGYITQGPKANFSHNDPYPQEAIDIGVIVGTRVKATHGGEVEGTGGTGLNKWVKVRGSCAGQNFTTLYLHLQTIDREIQKGKPVSMNQSIGTSGEYKKKQHLHYEFEGLEMAWPNIGYSTDDRIDDILEGCCGGAPPCSSVCSSHNVTW